MSGIRGARPTGEVSARVVGASRILHRRARHARLAARQFPEDSQHAAALRGKAKAFDEAADLVERLDRGLALNGRNDRLRRRIDEAAS